MIISLIFFEKNGLFAEDVGIYDGGDITIGSCPNIIGSMALDIIDSELFGDEWDETKGVSRALRDHYIQEHRALFGYPGKRYEDVSEVLERLDEYFDLFCEQLGIPE